MDFETIVILRLHDCLVLRHFAYQSRQVAILLADVWNMYRADKIEMKVVQRALQKK